MILLQNKTLPTSGSTRKHVLCLPAHTHPQPAELLPLFAATLAWVCSLHFLFFWAERAIWTHSQGDNGGKRGQIDHTRIFQVFVCIMFIKIPRLKQVTGPNLASLKQENILHIWSEGKRHKHRG